jgi:hypothetical protein
VPQLRSHYSWDVVRCQQLFSLQFAFCGITGVEKWQLVGCKANSLINHFLLLILSNFFTWNVFCVVFSIFGFFLKDFDF